MGIRPQLQSRDSENCTRIASVAIVFIEVVNEVVYYVKLINFTGVRPRDINQFEIYSPVTYSYTTVWNEIASLTAALDI